MSKCQSCGSEVSKEMERCGTCGLKVGSQPEHSFQEVEEVINRKDVNGVNMSRRELKEAAQRQLSGTYGDWLHTLLVCGALIIIPFVLFWRVTLKISEISLYNSLGYSSDSVSGWGFFAIILYLVLLLGACVSQSLIQWTGILSLEGRKLSGLKLLNRLIKEKKGRVIRANVLVAMYTFFWSLLLVLPGVVKGAGYAMTNYLLAKNEDLMISEAIELSQKMMKGYKLEYLILLYSFTIWNLLTVYSLGIFGLYTVPYQGMTTIMFLDKCYENYVTNNS